MGIMPDFVCVYLRVPPWDRAGKVSLLLGDQNFLPFQPQGTLKGSHHEDRMAASFEYSPRARRPAACLNELPSLVKVMSLIGT